MGTEKARAMGKKSKSKTPPVIPQPRVRLISIDFFISGIIDDRNSTLLGGFLHQEKVSGRVRDTKTNYASRFEEFKGK